MAEILARLDEFSVSKTSGFLPYSAPLQSLTLAYYSPWEEEAALLPTSIRTGVLRQRIAALPILKSRGLMSEEEWRRAYVVLGFLSNGYLFCERPPAATLPACLAQPMLEVSQHLGVPCVPTYCGQTLWNFQCLRPQSDESPSQSSAQNFQTLVSFTGSPEESSFFSTSVAIEACGATLIPTLLEALEHARCGKSADLVSCLRHARATLCQMEDILADIYKTCSPQFFYNTLRPFLEGTANLESVDLPQGVFYENMFGNGSYQKFRGPSNAQSALFVFIDKVLGVKHKHNTFLQEMRWYMPRSHRLFLEEVDRLPSIGDFMVPQQNRSNQECIENVYNNCVSALASFRRKHIEAVTRYVVTMAAKPRQDADSATTPDDKPILEKQPMSIAGSRGTGGTLPVDFLKAVRDDVLRAKTRVGEWGGGGGH